MDDPRSEIAKSVAIDIAGYDDLELIAAQPADLPRLLNSGQKALRHLLEQRIAGRMAKRIIDLLEAVEIEQQDAAGAVLLKV
jgi:hypothetical protein